MCTFFLSFDFQENLHLNFNFISLQSEIQRKAELIMREQILQGFKEQRALVDALTNVSSFLFLTISYVYLPHQVTCSR